MNRLEALQILEAHNAWRRGAETPATDPTLLGEAIDVATKTLRFDPIEFIIKKLPLWVTCDGFLFSFHAFHNGREFRIAYTPVDELPIDGWLNPILGGYKSFLYLNEEPNDLESFNLALKDCLKFLQKNKKAGKLTFGL